MLQAVDVCLIAATDLLGVHLDYVVVVHFEHFGRCSLRYARAVEQKLQLGWIGALCNKTHTIRTMCDKCDMMPSYVDGRSDRLTTRSAYAFISLPNCVPRFTLKCTSVPSCAATFSVICAFVFSAVSSPSPAACLLSLLSCWRDENEDQIGPKMANET